MILCIDVNGKTIHVVQRSPPSAQAANASAASSSAAEAGQPRGERRRMDGNSFVVGSFSLPPDATDVNQVHVSMIIPICLQWLKEVVSENPAVFVIQIMQMLL